MARFRASIKGQRGEASRLGSARTGLSARVNGWHSGVRIEAGVTPDDRDVFDVYITSGSNGAHHDQHVGRASLTAHGLRWEPTKGR